MKKIFVAALVGLSTATLFGCASKSADVVKLDAGTYQAKQGKVTTSLKLSDNGEFNEIVVTPTAKQQQYFHGTYRLNQAKNKVLFSVEQLTTVTYGTKSQTVKNQAPITVESASSAKHIPAIRMTAKGKLRLGSASLQPKKLELASQSDFIKHEQKLYQQTYGSLETYAYDSSQKPNNDGSYGKLAFKGNRFFWDITLKDGKFDNKTFVTGEYVFDDETQKLHLKPTNRSALYEHVVKNTDGSTGYYGSEDSPITGNQIVLEMYHTDGKKQLSCSEPDYGTYLQGAAEHGELESVNQVETNYEDQTKVPQDMLQEAGSDQAFQWYAWKDFSNRVAEDTSDYVIGMAFSSVNNDNSLQIWRIVSNHDRVNPKDGTFYAFNRDDGNVFYVGDWDQIHDMSEDPETSTAVADLVGNVVK